MRSTKKATSTRSGFITKKTTVAKRKAANSVRNRKAANNLRSRKVAKKASRSTAVKLKRPLAKKLVKKQPKKLVTKTRKLLEKPKLFFMLSAGTLGAALSFLAIMVVPSMIAQNTKDDVLGVTISGAPVNPAFTDPIFYACVIDSLNNNFIGLKNNRTYSHNITDYEMNSLIWLDCTSMNNTKGLEKLKGLKSLDLADSKITNIDVSKNTKLDMIRIIYCNLSSIDISKNTDLRHLDLTKNNISSINLTNNKKLSYMLLDDNKLSSIDVTNNTKLTTFQAHSNKLTRIDISKNTLLQRLNLSSNSITTIDVTKNKALDYLLIGRNRLTSTYLLQNTKLVTLGMEENNISSIDLSNNPRLEYLNLSSNELTSLDLSKNLDLNNLILSWNKLVRLDLQKHKKIKWLGVENIPTMKDLRIFTSPKYYIHTDAMRVDGVDSDIKKLLSNIKPTSWDAEAYILRNGSILKKGTLAPGDELAIHYKSSNNVVLFSLNTNVVVRGNTEGTTGSAGTSTPTNPGKITYAKWYNKNSKEARLIGSEVAQVKFMSDTVQDGYTMTCYNNNGVQISDTQLPNKLFSADSAGNKYRYSNDYYTYTNRKCYVGGYKWNATVGKNIWSAAREITN